MRVGISTATFFSKELTENSFSVIRSCGANLCEVFLTTLSEYEASFVDMLNDRLQSEGIQAYSVHALNTQFEPQLFNAAQRTRADAEIIYRKVLCAAQKLGAKYYTFHGSIRMKKGAYFSPVAIGKRMCELGEIASEYGVTLCLENVHWALFNEPSFYQEMKTYAKNVGTVLDIKQARQSGVDWREYISVMGASLKNVHVSDVDEEGNITMVGKGIFPFDELIKRLEEVGYDGPIIIEQYSKNYENYAEVEASVDYLKKLIGGEGNAN